MTDKFQRQNIGGLNRFNNNNYGFVHVSNVEGLDKFVNQKLTLSNSVSSNGASTDNAIVRYDGTTGQTIQNSGVVIDDNDEITGVNKLTSVELRTNTYNDGIGHSGFFLTTGANGVVQLTKDTYKGTQDALLSVSSNGTIQKSNLVSSDVATIDDSLTSTSSTWSSSKVSAEISAGGGADVSFCSFTKSTNNSSAGFFSDSYVVIGWDGYDEIMIRQPTARSGVYATGLVTYGGSYPSGQHMLISTVSNDFYQNASTGQVEFTISADSDNTHPFYRVRFHISSGTGTDYCYAIVEKFT
jgi:hypothetical protein